MPQSDVQDFTCSACGRSFKWKPELAGKKAKCKCGSVITVPNAPGVAKADGASGGLPPVPGSAPRSSSRSAAAPTRSMSRAPAAAPPPPPPPPPPPSEEADPFAMMDNPDEYSFKDDPTPVQRQAAAVGTGMMACPSCGNTLSPSAKLCVNCGYNLTTGEKLGTQVARTPKGQGGAAVKGKGKVKAAKTEGGPSDPKRFWKGGSSIFFGVVVTVISFFQYQSLAEQVADGEDVYLRKWDALFYMIGGPIGVFIGWTIIGAILVVTGVLIIMGKISWESDKD